MLNFKCDDATVIERTSGRWIHKASGRTYHSEFRKPQVHGKDDVTGESLYQRDDDKPDVVAKRLADFKSITAPIIDHYRNMGKVTDVDAEQGMATVQKDIKAVMDGKPAPSTSMIDVNIAKLKRQLAWLEARKLW